MFCISLIPHTVIERNIQSQIPKTIHRWHSQTDQLQLVNSYGLFRRSVCNDNLGSLGVVGIEESLRARLSRGGRYREGLRG